LSYASKTLQKVIKISLALKLLGDDPRQLMSLAIFGSRD